MRKCDVSPRFCLAVLVLLAVGMTPHARAHAAGRVALSWNDCSPIVTTIPSVGAQPYSVYVSVIGHTEPHKAYQWFAYLRSQSPPTYRVPDAWRFDATGCQTPSLIRIDHLPPSSVAKTCPAFQGSASSLQIQDYSYDQSSGRVRIVLANSYPDGVTVVDPNVRYFLGRVEFDHSYSVIGPGTPAPEPGLPALTCGGFEADLKLTFVLECSDPRFCDRTKVSWLDLDGFEHPFEIENSTVTFCGSCAPTPAVRSTWGAIKDTYRR